VGHGMFVRPAKVTVLAQPPPPPKPAARKGRPSSLLSRSSAPADLSMTKRMSLNAPSPSPVPRPSRPTSALRVSPVCFAWLTCLV
jgi:dynactin 1